MTPGVPLREALALPALRNVRVLAGGGGLGRAVRYVNVMEVPDILDWVKPDELLLTTAYPLRDDRAALADLVPRLADRGLAGLAVKPARYLDAVPVVMLEAAERLGFPLLELPPETALADIINAVLSLILNARSSGFPRQAEAGTLLEGEAAAGVRWAVLAADGPLGDDQRMALEQAVTIAALRVVQARAVAEADRHFQAVCLEELVTGHVA